MYTYFKKIAKFFDDATVSYMKSYFVSHGSNALQSENGHLHDHGVHVLRIVKVLSYCSDMCETMAHELKHPNELNQQRAMAGSEVGLWLVQDVMRSIRSLLQIPDDADSSINHEIATQRETLRPSSIIWSEEKDAILFDFLRFLHRFDGRVAPYNNFDYYYRHVDLTDQELKKAFEDCISVPEPIYPFSVTRPQSRFDSPWPQLARLADIIDTHLSKQKSHR
jgi:hypothetical protein